VLKKYDDDLFKDSTMTFGEHLEELRSALFKALLWLVAGCAFGFYVGDWVVQFINTPLEAALGKYYQTQAIRVVEDEVGALSEAQKTAIVDRQMIFEPVYIEPQAVLSAINREFPDDAAHIELPKFYLSSADIDRTTLVAALEKQQLVTDRTLELLPDSTRAIAKEAITEKQVSSSQWKTLVLDLNKLLARRDFYDEAAFEKVELSDSIREKLDRRDGLSQDEVRSLNWELLHAAYPSAIGTPQPTLIPIMLWRKISNDDRLKPKSLGVQEPFFLWLKACILTGLVVASPMIFYHLWMFVAAGLYPHERRYVHVLLPFSIGLFIGGVCLALFFVFEPVLNFFFNFNADLGIDPDPRIGEWLGFFLFLPFGFGIAFQLPIVMLFLERIGIFTVQSYLSKWKIAVFIIVVLACVLTPADPISFMFLGAPLLVLYFGGIGLCMLARRKNAPAIS
jgi:sec-independent protein translocase protein TatC